MIFLCTKKHGRPDRKACDYGLQCSQLQSKLHVGRGERTWAERSYEHCGMNGHSFASTYFYTFPQTFFQNWDWTICNLIHHFCYFLRIIIDLLILRSTLIRYHEETCSLFLTGSTSPLPGRGQWLRNTVAECLIFLANLTPYNILTQYHNENEFNRVIL